MFSERGKMVLGWWIFNKEQKRNIAHCLIQDMDHRRTVCGKDAGDYEDNFPTNMRKLRDGGEHYEACKTCIAALNKLSRGILALSRIGEKSRHCPEK